MALGRRGGVDEGLWVPTTELARSLAHPFCAPLDRLLNEAGFDRFAEHCRPPGDGRRFHRHVGGTDSQSGIASLCSGERDAASSSDSGGRNWCLVT